MEKELSENNDLKRSLAEKQSELNRNEARIQAALCKTNISSLEELGVRFDKLKEVKEQLQRSRQEVEEKLL